MFATLFTLPLAIDSPLSSLNFKPYILLYLFELANTGTLPVDGRKLDVQQTLGALKDFISYIPSSKNFCYTTLSNLYYILTL
jgi:hypothetical protein